MKRNILITIGGFLVILLFIFIFQFKNFDENTEPQNTIAEIDSIQGYEYILEDRDTELYKTLFKELNDVLTSEVVDYDKYAEIISKLYIIDLYTIENKLNKYDIGSKEFVYPDARENFELKVGDTIYKYVEDNSFGKREQDLPSVASIDVEEMSAIKVQVESQEYDGYRVTLSWTYVKDEDYDKNCILTLVKFENKLYVIKQDNKN